VERRFAEPVVSEDFMLATVKQLAGDLAKTLEERGEGARALEAVFFRADGAIRRIAVETGAPSRDPAILERLFREKLGSLADPLDPGFGFDLIRLEALRTEVFRDDANAFDSSAVNEKDIRHLIDRLAARFGSHRVLSFRPNDSHIPENAFVAVPAQYAPNTTLSWHSPRLARAAPRRPLRLITPEPVNMLPGQTTRFRWRTVVHAVRHLEGPERIAMEWWKMPGPTRDYFRMEDEEGRRFWLYREEGAGWFLQGLFA
jgi:protein ImuB